MWDSLPTILDTLHSLGLKNWIGLRAIIMLIEKKKNEDDIIFKKPLTSFIYILYDQVQTGATIGEVIYKIAEESKLHGFPARVCPTMGVGGHFGGGGYGNMMRKHGLTVDQIIDAKIIDVNRKLLDRKAMGEDLFWAITGGGGSSFGVVVAYKIRLVRVPETVTVFRVRRTLEENELTEIVDEWQRVAHVIDNDLFIRVTFDVVNGTHKGNKTLRATFLAMFLGDSKTLLSLINNSFPKLGSVLFGTDVSFYSKIYRIGSLRFHILFHSPIGLHRNC